MGKTSDAAKGGYIKVKNKALEVLKVTGLLKYA
jgi:hypothetical protein